MVKIRFSRSLGWNLDRMKMERTQIIADGADCYPWRETFVMWPRKSITGAPLFWTKAYKRKVWVVWGTGFHMEPEVQYATAFDLLTYDDNNFVKA